MISRIDHVSIAVHDYTKALNFFENIFGAISGAKGTDDRLKYFWHILSTGDLTRIELIKPTGEGSFLDNFLNSRKDGGVHHITFETPDIQKIKEMLEKHNIPFFGFNTDQDRWKELFIHPKDAFGILIQIAEFDPNDYLGQSTKLPDNQKWVVEKLDGGAMISFAHPGGGKASFKLSGKDVKTLIDDLSTII